MDKSPGRGSATGTNSTDAVKEQVSQGAQQVQQTAGQVAQGATQQAESFADSKRSQVAQSLKTVAEALRTSGQELDKSDEKTASAVVDKMASGTDSVAGYLQNESVGQMVSDVESFARANTWPFLGGACILGLVAARFLKSSTPPNPQSTGYDRGYPYGVSGSGYGSARYGGTQQRTPYTGGAYGGTGSGGQYDSIQPEGQYRALGTGRAEDTSGTPDVQVKYASGMTEGSDGTTG